MQTVQEIYQSKGKTANEALDLIQDGDYMFSAQAAGEPTESMSHLQHLKETGVKGCHLNTCLPLKDYPVFHDQEMKGILDHNAWFMSAGLRKAYKEKMVSPVLKVQLLSYEKLYLAVNMKTGVQSSFVLLVQWINEDI